MFPPALFAGPRDRARGLHRRDADRRHGRADRRALAASDGPLLEVVQLGPLAMNTKVFSAIALFALTNGALINMIMASRLIYGMSQQGIVPRAMGRVHGERRTPWVAIVFVAALAFALLLLGDLESLADTTVLLLLCVFVFVNIARARAAARSRSSTSTGARRPRCRCSAPLACAGLIVQKATEDAVVFAYAGGLLALGVVLWLISRALTGPAEPIDPASARRLALEPRVEGDLGHGGERLARSGRPPWRPRPSAGSRRRRCRGRGPTVTRSILRDREAVALLEDLHLGLGPDRLGRGAALREHRRELHRVAARPARRRSAPPGSCRRSSLKRDSNEYVAAELPGRAAERARCRRSGRPSTPPFAVLIAMCPPPVAVACVERRMVAGAGSLSSSVTYTDVMATTELLDLARPAAAAAGVDALNDRLAGEPGVPADVGRGRWRRSPPRCARRRWTAGPPPTRTWRCSCTARCSTRGRAVEDDARDALRIALERLSHALAALGGGRGGRRRAHAEGAGALARGARSRCRSATSPTCSASTCAASSAGSPRASARSPRARRRAACARSRGSSGSCGTRSRRRAWSRGSTGRGRSWAARRRATLLGDPVRLPDLLLAAGSTRSTAFA